jgi:hypothetical protein
MGHTNLSWRCYILPAIGGVVYYILTLPLVSTIFSDWIPDIYYANLVKALILFLVLFFVCRIMDLIWSDMCHDEDCINAANCDCIDAAANGD